MLIWSISARAYADPCPRVLRGASGNNVCKLLDVCSVLSGIYQSITMNVNHQVSVWILALFLSFFFEFFLLWAVFVSQVELDSYFLDAERELELQLVQFCQYYDFFTHCELEVERVSNIIINVNFSIQNPLYTNKTNKNGNNFKSQNNSDT